MHEIKDLAKLRKKYGNVMRFKFGATDGIILNTESSVKEAFKKTEFLDRPPNDGLSIIGFKSVFLANNLDLWKTQRSFVIRSMRDMGLGKLKLEEQIQDEICQLLNFIEDRHNIKIDVVEIMDKSTANNILSLTVGRRFDYEDPELLAMMRSVKAATKCMVRGAVYMCFPWLKRIAPLLRWPTSMECFDGYIETRTALLKIMDEHKMTFDPNNIRDLIDSYLLEVSKIGESSNFTEESLLITVMEFVGAGAETTSSCILWCIYMLAAYPDVKEKLLKEIEDIVGITEMPSMCDKTRMPYTQAFIYEIIRWVTIVPLAPLRYVTEDTTLSGYDISKNTAVVVNIWGIHHDPEFWEEPNDFKPDRFLEDDGETLKKVSSFIPFGTGKRKCPGEATAYMEVFLYLVLILQRFDLQFNPGVKPTFESIKGVSLQPRNYPIRMISRSNSSNITYLE